jgi:thymidylate synthase (FAD)
MNGERIKIINVNIADTYVAALARLSHGVELKEAGTKDNVSLVKRLWRRGHHSVFEFQQIIFEVKAPIFIVRQWMRHRTGTFLEKSMRYTKVEDDTWMYAPDKYGAVAKYIYKSYSDAIDTYYRLIYEGVPYEDARVVLPLGIYTHFYWRTDSRNLYNFLKLRLNPHAQKEIQDYAHDILELLKLHPFTKNIAEVWETELLNRKEEI